MIKKILMIMVLVLIPATFAFAQDSFFPCSGADCTLCDLGVVLNNLITLAIKFASGAAVAVAFIGGTMIMIGGDNPARLAQGKQALLSAIIGLIIVFSAWLMVDTVFKILVGDVSEQTQKIGRPWNDLICPVK